MKKPIFKVQTALRNKSTGPQVTQRLRSNDNTPGLAGFRMPKISKPNFKSPSDPTRDVLASGEPSNQSIYSNPVSTLEEIRVPGGRQVGFDPNGKASQGNF